MSRDVRVFHLLMSSW